MQWCFGMKNTNKKGIYERARLEMENLKLWIDSRKDVIENYVTQQASDHPAISLALTIDLITDFIKKGDTAAIQLGCDLLLKNKKICFGVSLKTRILSSLKTQRALIPKGKKWQLTKLTILLLSLDYPPREIKWYCKLIKSFDPQFRNKIIEKLVPKTREAQRWLDFFQKEKL